MDSVLYIYIYKLLVYNICIYIYILYMMFTIASQHIYIMIGHITH